MYLTQITGVGAWLKLGVVCAASEIASALLMYTVHKPQNNKQTLADECVDIIPAVDVELKFDHSSALTACVTVPPIAELRCQDGEELQVRHCDPHAAIWHAEV